MDHFDMTSTPTPARKFLAITVLAGLGVFYVYSTWFFTTRSVDFICRKRASERPAVDLQAKSSQLERLAWGVSGWSIGSDQVIWSEGRKSMIALRLADPAKGDLEFRLNSAAFTIPEILPQRIYTVSANRTKVGTWSYKHGEGFKDQSVTIPARLLRPDGMLVIELKTSLSPSPAELGISEDPRRLGLMIRDWRLLVPAAPR